MKTLSQIFYALSEKNYGKTANGECLTNFVGFEFDKKEAYKKAEQYVGKDIYVYECISYSTYDKETCRSGYETETRLKAAFYK